jgi:hypothetical protein
MPTKRGARAAPRSTSSKIVTESLNADAVESRQDLERVEETLCQGASGPAVTAAGKIAQSAAFALHARYDKLSDVAHETCDSFGLDRPGRGEATPAERLEFLQAAIDDERSRHEREMKSLREQLSTVRALLRTLAEAFDRTPTGQVLDGLSLQVDAVAKGGVR